ncbi:MAG: hypothetical protein AAGF96_14625 [Bacteroidota bacterium]
MRSAIVVVVFSILSFGCKSQTRLSRIEIVVPTVEQEATSIWRTINDITFFEKQGYTINLPKDALMDTLIAKSKNGTFGNEDFPIIHTLVENKVFNPKNYEKATQKVADQIDLINDMVHEIDAKRDQWDWKFKMFDTYKVVFTLYGTGGSYDPEEGTITLLTNENGGFVKYKNPAYTIIHEITHMGMEYSIVRKFNLPHGVKERIVDTFVVLLFQERLPEYKIQNMGDANINRYLNTKRDIGSLNAIVSEFVKK